MTHATPLTEDQQRRIEAAVERNFPRQIARTQALVSTPSLRGQERAGHDLLAEEFQALGLATDRWIIDRAAVSRHPGAGVVPSDLPEQECLVGSLGTPAADGTHRLILNGHIDVVPTGSARLWSRDPFDAVVEDGWLYGRGSGDMKAGLLANAFALRAVLDAGLTPVGSVQLQCVPEEESTGNGTLAALLRGHRADAVLIPEPIPEQLVRAQVGVFWASITVRTVAAHAAYRSEGVNAIDAAVTVITALRGLEERWNRVWADEEHFSDLDHPFNLNVGTMHSGDWPSSVPDECVLGIRAAFPPTVSAESAFAELAHTVRAAVSALPDTSVECERAGFFSDGYVLAPGSAAEALLASVHERVSGASLERNTSTGYIDSRCYGTYAGTPALVYGPLAERVHGADERVSLASVQRVTTALALFLAEWCGVREAG
ncbi:ArgE/DapE family deacylase [Leucobacter sp. M11]|uniref:ArgE/DapE family deacylase n=1 Tax=Leucobacter sp. M11 TaxID=2993565 RepID=UPI002D7F7AC7|nr:ArgE/DapE family deacylase [Leucobacter sp. M11]MEB4615687.1 ArgE/DapE family deacylase [Leucobacter sp. M11]